MEKFKRESFIQVKAWEPFRKGNIGRRDIQNKLIQMIITVKIVC